MRLRESLGLADEDAFRRDDDMINVEAVSEIVPFTLPGLVFGVSPSSLAILAVTPPLETVGATAADGTWTRSGSATKDAINATAVDTANAASVRPKISGSAS